MNSRTPSLHQVLGVAGQAAGHLAALVIGVVLMVVGLALGVTMIMLPVGIVVGLAGVCVFLVGLFAPFTWDEQ
jgi:hypothetical protein